MNINQKRRAMRMLYSRHSCGIYLISCLSNNRVYIGQSHCVKLRIKTQRMKLRNKTNANKEMQADFNIYGDANFKFEIIEQCDFVNLIKRETEVILENISNGVNVYNVLYKGSKKRKPSIANKVKTHSELIK